MSFSILYRNNHESKQMQVSCNTLSTADNQFLLTNNKRIITLIIPAILYFLLVFILLANLSPAIADVRMPAIFSDNMVLQRGVPISIYGWALPGEKVTVSLANNQQSTLTGADWGWQVKLPALPAGGPYTLNISGNNNIVITNILIGEVWVCSGQSNMEWPVQESLNGAQEVAAADNPNIRLFTVRKSISLEEQVDCSGNWLACSPATVKNFSAIGYFFARDLSAKLKVPVGIINLSWGGTVIEAWTDAGTLNSDLEFRPIMTELQQEITDYSRNFYEVYRNSLRDWITAADTASALGQPPPLPPVLYVNNDPRLNGNAPTVLFNSMVAPLTRTNIAGILWYQGESHGGFAKRYRRLFPAMINGWRKAWQQETLPFLFVQLPNYNASGDPQGVSWAEVREAQAVALKLPNTGMAVTIDIGEADAIHPLNKQEVAHRLLLNALGVVYGSNDEYSGPLYAGMVVEGKRIRVNFSHVGNGLIARGRTLTGFTIAGKDNNFVPANAVIDGVTVLVSSPKIDNPIAVRYAWANNPECNLYNKENLPASPFRSDIPQ